MTGSPTNWLLAQGVCNRDRVFLREVALDAEDKAAFVPEEGVHVGRSDRLLDHGAVDLLILGDAQTGEPVSLDRRARSTG